MNIYICGGSAVGKTTFCEYISMKYNIPISPEVIRMETGWFFNKSLLHRETLFLLTQIYKERSMDGYIFDRSILDVVCWMIDNHDANLYKYVNEHYVDENGVYIITPPENEEFVREHLNDYLTDPIRVKALSDKLGFDIEQDTDLFIEEYPKFAQFERESMRQMLVGKVKPVLVYYNVDSKELKDYKWEAKAEVLIYKLFKGEDK